MLNNVKRGIVILLALCLAALAGCSLAYVDSADAKVVVTGEAEQLSLTLATAKGEVEYRSLSASGTGSFTFPSIYFGDYIDNGPEDLMSTGFWTGVRDGAEAFAEAYNADGGDCTVVNLPDEGITGNSHFMFQEMNNDVIAQHIENWLGEHALN